MMVIIVFGARFSLHCVKVTAYFGTQNPVEDRDPVTELFPSVKDDPL